MILEKSVEWLAGETEVLGENLPQCRFVHHKQQLMFLKLHSYWRQDCAIKNKVINSLDMNEMYRMEIANILKKKLKILGDR
jgi:hypothetical protein